MRWCESLSPLVVRMYWEPYILNFAVPEAHPYIGVLLYIRSLQLTLHWSNGRNSYIQIITPQPLFSYRLFHIKFYFIIIILTNARNFQCPVSMELDALYICSELVSRSRTLKLNPYYLSYIAALGFLSKPQHNYQQWVSSASRREQRGLNYIYNLYLGTTLRRIIFTATSAIGITHLTRQLKRSLPSPFISL